MYRCLWCGEIVAAEGDTCNLACYTAVFNALNVVRYLKDNDMVNDLHLQPWAEALTNTQEG